MPPAGPGNPMRWRMGGDECDDVGGVGRVRASGLTRCADSETDSRHIETTRDSQLYCA